jgi:hypothetical protein
LPPRRDWWRRKRGKPARLPHKNLPLKEKQFISAVKGTLCNLANIITTKLRNAHLLFIRDNQYRQKSIFLT